MLTSSRAIVGDFYKRVAATPPSAWADKIGWKQPSDQDAETYAMTGATPGMREWVNERLLSALREDKITIHNIPFEGSFTVPMDDLRRDKTGQYRVRAGELGARAGWQHWHKLMTPLLVEGDNSTYGTSYDGQYFFDTDHVVGDSGTIKNILTSTEVTPLEVVAAANPTSIEMAEAILGVINYMRRWNDDQGEPVNEDATGFLVMVPANLAAAAEAAAYDENLHNATFVGHSNPLKSRSVNVDVAMNPRFLTLASGDTAVFYVFRTDGVAKPLIAQTELEPVMNVLEEGSEYTAMNNKAAFMAKSSRNVGYGEWMYAARATLLTAS